MIFILMELESTSGMLALRIYTSTLRQGWHYNNLSRNWHRYLNAIFPLLHIWASMGTGEQCLQI